MARMIDMIRQSAVPPHLLRAASKGALSVPPAEMIEILVYLAKNPVFREQAKMTLAGWDEAACLAVARDPNAPVEVLEYMVHADNRRPALFPALLENRSVPESRLVEAARAATRETLAAMLASPRVHGSAAILQALASNSQLKPGDAELVKQLLAKLGMSAESKLPQATEGELLTDEKSQYEIEHAAEIAAEEGKPFQLVGGADEELVSEEQLGESADVAAATATASATPTGAAAAPAKKKAPGEREKISVLQKIARMSVGERVQLAMKGNKDERFLLVRDGARVVALAVLESPKVTDTEAERFASMKNVQDVVLRTMAQKRRFMKQYAVIRNLTFNPKLPIDVGLTLLNHLLLADLKNLSSNKEVPETVKKMALRLFVQKSDTRGKRD